MVEFKKKESTVRFPKLQLSSFMSALRILHYLLFFKIDYTSVARVTRMKNRTQSSSYRRYSPVKSSYKRQPSPHTSPALPTEISSSRLEVLACRASALPPLLSNFNISGLFTHSVPRLRAVHSPPSTNNACQVTSLQHRNIKTYNQKLLKGS
jgi:hypothetical protein